MPKIKNTVESGLYPFEQERAKGASIQIDTA